MCHLLALDMCATAQDYWEFFMEIKIRKIILLKSFSNFVAGKAVLIEKAKLYLDPQMIIINMKL